MAEYDDKIYNINPVNNSNSSIHTDSENINEYIDMFYDLISVPNWGTQDFILERLKWRTQGIDGSSVSKFAEPGNYFYKVFFNFNTAFGLFGGILMSENGKYGADINSAWQYLTNNIDSGRYNSAYTNFLINRRSNLINFTSILNYITNECPWFFKSIEGLQSACEIDFANIVKNDRKYITLSFNQDAIDMRVATLFDLYRNSCYDFENFREVIPENLRKFDMCILMFNPPIIGMNIDIDAPRRNTVGTINSPGIDDPVVPKVDNYKISLDTSTSRFSRLLGNESDEMNLSFRALMLKNCEIDPKSIINFPDQLSNESGFKGEYSVKILYDRSYIVNVNNELVIKTIDGYIPKPR